MIQSMHIALHLDKMPPVLERMLKTKEQQIQNMKAKWAKEQTPQDTRS